LVELLERPMAVAIDGADEVAPDWSLIKGGGGALFREKAVALACERYVVVVTAAKLVAHLGAFPLPVEVVPFAAPYVRREIERAWGDIAVTLRKTGERTFVTDNDNCIFDCRFDEILDPPALDAQMRAIHGVVATGLFFGMVRDVIVGEENGKARSLA
jgi:ribose 5-phosphate isomerase A